MRTVSRWCGLASSFRPLYVSVLFIFYYKPHNRKVSLKTITLTIHMFFLNPVFPGSPNLHGSSRSCQRLHVLFSFRNRIVWMQNSAVYFSHFPIYQTSLKADKLGDSIRSFSEMHKVLSRGYIIIDAGVPSFLSFFSAL